MSDSENAGTGKRGSVSYVDAREGDAGQRIDNFLLRVLKDVPKSRVYRLLRKGEVRVNGRRARPEQRLVEGDRVRIPPVQVQETKGPPPASRSLQQLIVQSIIYEDRDLLVVNKPAGVAVHGGSGLAHGVIEALRAARPELDELELVHRLDRETSGCLLLAKRRPVLRELHAMLREREMDKQYLALVVGHWSLGKKKMDMPLKTNLKQGGERVVRVHPDGQPSLSLFKPVQFFGRTATLMEVSIGTGRTHQIRVHAAHAGHPIAGDDKYGDHEANEKLQAFGLRRMFLQAQSLSFKRPHTDEIFSINAPLDDELRAVLDALEERATRKSAGSKTRR